MTQEIESSLGRKIEQQNVREFEQERLEREEAA